MPHLDRIALRVTLTVLTAALGMHSARGQESSSSASTGGSAASAGQNATGQLEEVVVTAQRRLQNIQNVPISITALSQSQMDAEGVQSIDDIAALTPGVTFQRADARNGEASDISIRGIDSQAGAGTTGIYIDDTPIQIRNLGYSAFNTFPQVFDLDRVEVLRGPQGTLFGAGSEGGTVRFITPQPDLSTPSVYARSELSYTEDGQPSYESGIAAGTPIVEDTLAVRASVWYRNDGGWVDRTAWDQTDTAHEPTTDEDPNSNWQNSSAAKLAFLWAPIENLRITPSIYYQDVKLNDTPFFWQGLSNPSDGVFNNGNLLTATSDDRFTLPALKIDWRFSGMELISDTSYFDRSNHAVNDYTEFEAAIWTGTAAEITGHLAGATPYPPLGYAPAPAYQLNSQENLTQEIRLQSDDASARVSWVTGFFFSRESQTAGEIVQDTSLPGFILSQTGLPLTALFGQGLYEGLYTFYANPIESRDQQTALYGQADIKLTDNLILTAGARVGGSKVDVSANYAGPVVGPPVSDSGSQDSHPVTPKGGLSYKFDPNDMIYASATKGFRVGGYNPRVGAPCDGELAALGLSGTPKLYGPDSVWSYEVGSKNDFLDQRVILDTSLYYIDWKNIQQPVDLAECGFEFVDNLGSATSEGFDFQGQFAVTQSFHLGVSVGYTDAKFNQTVKAGPLATSNLVTNGDHLVGWPWTGTVSAVYNFVAFAGHESYVRIAYQFQSPQNELIARNDPQDSPIPIGANFFELPGTSLLSARFGVHLGAVDVSLFGNNLANAHPILQQSASPQTLPTEPVILQQETFRPRTYGVTAIYRY